jgi:starvation-inducible DNA-binding protein
MQDTLQGLVAHCVDLALQTKHAHWNVRGIMFKPVHEQLDGIYSTLTGAADTIAERMAALDFPVDGNSSSLASATSFEKLAVEFMTPASIVTAISTRLRKVVSAFEAAGAEITDDLVTQNLILEIAHDLDKDLWMLRVQSEGDVAAAGKTLDAKEAAAGKLAKLAGSFNATRKFPN